MTLRGSPFSLTLGTLVRAKIRAINGQGSGPFSQVNAAGGLIETEPAAVTGLTHDTSSSTVNSNRITWPDLIGNTYTGRSPITGYEIDQADNFANPVWSTLATVAPGVGAYLATGLTGGTTYIYRVRAQNLHGDGPYSSLLSALTAQAPDKPTAPTTSQVATGVRVSWTAPNYNFLAILEFEITIADSAGLFAKYTLLCDGASEAAKTDLACVVPMASLTSAPLSLSVGALVKFKVRARNARGWSLTSDANTSGVLAQSVPVRMGAPFTDAAQTGETQVYVEWTALSSPSDTGGSAVTSYHVRWDAGAGIGSW